MMSVRISTAPLPLSVELANSLRKARNLRSLARAYRPFDLKLKALSANDQLFLRHIHEHHLKRVKRYSH